MKRTDEENAISAARHVRWEEPERAIQLLAGFLADHPGSKRAMLLLASIFSDDYGEGVAGAEKLFRKVLAEYPHSVSALSGLALLNGRHDATVSKDESLQLLQRASEFSGDPEILRNLANKAWDVGRLDRALTAFERMLIIASARELPHLVDEATSAIREIKAGIPSSSTQYSWPEIDE